MWIAGESKVFRTFIILCFVVIGWNFSIGRMYAENLSTIAGVEIHASNKKDIESELRQEIDSWSEMPAVVRTTNGLVQLPSELFDFDVDRTVGHFMKESKPPWYLFWKRTQSAAVPIQFQMAEAEVRELLQKVPSIKVNDTIEKVKREIGEQLADTIEAVQIDRDILENKRIAFTSRKYPFSDTSFEYIPDTFKEVIIEPDSYISILELAAESEIESNDEMLTHLASTIYDLLLQTNYEVLERHPTIVKLPGFTAGTEAGVNSLRGEDFKFVNPNMVQGTLRLSLQEGRMRAELFSIPLGIHAEMYQRDKEIVKRRTVVRYSSTLAYGDEKTLEVGEDGLKVSTYRMVMKDGDSYVSEELMSKDFYPPVHRIVEHSLRPDPKTGSSGSSSSSGEPSENDEEGNSNSSSGTSGSGSKDSENKKENQNSTSKDEESADNKNGGTILDKGGNPIDL